MQPARKLKDFSIKLSKCRAWVIVDSLEGFSFDGGSGKQYHTLIVVNPSTSRQNYLDNVVHETMHRSLPNATEATVARVATDIADVLWKMGWRLK